MGNRSAPVGVARLDPWALLTKELGLKREWKQVNVPLSPDHRREARNDLAWAISVGGIGVVVFASFVLFAWYFAAALFLIFAGILLGVALNAMTQLLGRVVAWPHSLRLAIVCLALAGMLSGVIFLGGTTIAQQATALSNTIKSQLVRPGWRRPA
jgi:predicted PurR-regulated permease PerM